MTSTMLTTFFLCALGASFASACNSTCTEDLERAYISEIQDRLLREMKHPKRMLNISAPELSEKEMEALVPDFDPEEFIETQLIILPTPCPGNISEPGCFQLRPSRSARNSLMRAQLRFNWTVADVFTNLPPFQRGEERLFSVAVNRVYSSGSLEEILSETFPIGSSGKFELDMSLTEIKAWLAEKVVGLKITVEHNGERHTFTPSFGLAALTSGPNMLIWTEAPKRRSKRDLENYCAPEDDNKFCCLHDFVVDFEKLGWNFIMAPKRYNAFMCRGECDFRSNHLIRFGHSKLIKDTHLGGLTCCHPSEYQSLKIIYLRTTTEIAIIRVPGMVAHRCACT